MGQKKSFLVHHDYYELLTKLSLEDKGLILEAMFCFSLGKEIPKLKPLTEMAFNFIKRQMEHDLNAYDKKCNKNKNNALKRWDNKDDSTTVNDSEQSNANACDRMRIMRTHANHADNDKHNDKDNDKHKEKDNIYINKSSYKEKPDNISNINKFNIPSLQEINKYILEKKYNIDPEYFFNYYQANGWMVGKNKMKNWKAALANWNARNKKDTPEVQNEIWLGGSK